MTLLAINQTDQDVTLLQHKATSRVMVRFALERCYGNNIFLYVRRQEPSVERKAGISVPSIIIIVVCVCVMMMLILLRLLH